MFQRTLVSMTAAVSTVLLVAPSTAYADGARDDQWYLDSLDVLKAHQLSQGEGVTVGVVDTGVDASHPVLVGTVTGGVGFNRGAKDGMSDEYDHGTGIASIVAGNGKSGGVLGIAPKAEILSVAVCDSKCDDTEQGIREGIRWLVDKKVDVITISMGSDPAEEDSIEAAVAAGIPVVAIAGNLKVSTKDLGEIEVKGTAWPAVAKGVIPVSGTTKDGKFWDGSRDLVGAAPQPRFGISAPATDLPSAKAGGGYATHSGTSGSAPIVAGTLALIKSAYPNLTYEQVNERLLSTVDDKGPKEYDDQFGWGIVNPYRALTEDVKHFKGGTSTKADMIPLDEQGKGASSNSDDKDGSSTANGQTLDGSTSSTSIILVSVIVALVFGAAVVVMLVVAKRRGARNTPATPGSG